MTERSNNPRDMQTIIDEHARSAVMRCLDETGGTANDEIVGVYLDIHGMRMSGERRREVIAWLAREGLVTATEKGSVVVVQLTRRGLEMLENRIVVEGMMRIWPWDR